MTGDTVTLALHGDHIPLEDYAQAVAHFAELVGALSAAADAPKLAWEIESLEVSSALTTAQAVRLNGYSPAHVERVTRSFIEVGSALRAHTAIPYPDAVQKAARGIARVLQDGVESVRFETAETDVMVTEAYQGAVAAPVAPAPPVARGAVTGRVQALTSRSSLRFTLYDLLHDKAVSCYVPAGSEELMRGIWGKLVVVEGAISRDPSSDRPVTIRQVDRVTTMDEPVPGAYLRARGALAGRRPGEGRPEERIRRMRDGEST